MLEVLQGLLLFVLYSYLFDAKSKGCYDNVFNFSIAKNVLIDCLKIKHVVVNIIKPYRIICVASSVRENCWKRAEYLFRSVFYELILRVSCAFLRITVMNLEWTSFKWSKHGFEKYSCFQHIVERIKFRTNLKFGFPVIYSLITIFFGRLSFSIPILHRAFLQELC